ncbi:MAG: galactokinase family protein [Rhodothermia bacterium]|nr:MAG: galactokinase family protein [Rhodothermia bacterium]
MRSEWTALKELTHRQSVQSLLGEMLDERLNKKLEELPTKGLDAVSSRNISDRIAEAANHLSGGADSSARAVAVYCPARIEVVGKHTDYAGGSSLTCASQRSFCMVATNSREPGLRLEDLVSGTSALIPFEDDPGDPGPLWTAYPRTVLKRYCANFGVPQTGISLVFSSDIPRASGMSSSSAFVIGTWICIAALSEVTQFDSFQQNIQTGADLAAYMACVENGFAFKDLRGDAGVGTMGGAQDHAAILFSEPRTLGLFQYRPLRRLETVSLPTDLTFVIASSGMRAQKTTGAKGDYNSVVRLAAQSVDIWSKAMGEKRATLRDVVTSCDFSLDAFESCVNKKESDVDIRYALLNRVRQFIEETQIVIPGVIESLQTGDYESLQRHVFRSQQMADEWLGNQVTETRHLVDAARDNGALASSAFGAGFGGSVWALVPSKDSLRFLEQWFAAYGRSFQHRLRKAYFFQEKTGPGAFVLGADVERLLFKSNF